MESESGVKRLRKVSVWTVRIIIRVHGHYALDNPGEGEGGLLKKESEVTCCQCPFIYKALLFFRNLYACPL